MTTDTTGVSFKFYNEGENAKILLGVTILEKYRIRIWSLRSV